MFHFVVPDRISRKNVPGQLSPNDTVRVVYARYLLDKRDILCYIMATGAAYRGVVTGVPKV